MIAFAMLWCTDCVAINAIELGCSRKEAKNFTFAAYYAGKYPFARENY